MTCTTSADALLASKPPPTTSRSTALASYCDALGRRRCISSSTSAAQWHSPANAGQNCSTAALKYSTHCPAGVHLACTRAPAPPYWWRAVACGKAALRSAGQPTAAARGATPHQQANASGQHHAAATGRQGYHTADGALPFARIFNCP
eukprot:653564-Prymnesium_polylepis.1